MTDDPPTLTGSVQELVAAAQASPELAGTLRRFALALLAALPEDAVDAAETMNPAVAPGAPAPAPAGNAPEPEPEAVPAGPPPLLALTLETLAEVQGVQARLGFKAECYALLQQNPLASSWDALRDVQALARTLSVDLGFVARGVRELPLAALARLEIGYRLAALAAVAAEEMLTRPCPAGLLPAAARAQHVLFDVRGDLAVGMDADLGWVHQVLLALASDRGEWVGELQSSARVPEWEVPGVEASLRALLGAPGERVRRPRAKAGAGAKAKVVAPVRPRTGAERAVLSALVGRTLVVVGGEVDHLAVERLRVALGLGGVVWVALGPEAASQVGAALSRHEVPVVVFLPRFSSHAVFGRVRAVVEERGVPGVLLRSGFHPASVLRQVAEQASVRLAGPRGGA